jgi:hypothetical protein
LTYLQEEKDRPDRLRSYLQHGFSGKIQLCGD